MAVLIEERSGDAWRRCDARCHHAKGDKCRCICGGRNHGRGGAGTLPLFPKDIRLILGLDRSRK
jgi:hypothetical protein